MEIEELRHLANINLIFVCYEELVYYPERIQTMLGECIRVRFVGSFREYYKIKKELAYRYEGVTSPIEPAFVFEDKPINTLRAGKWILKEHQNRIYEQFTEYPILFNSLKKYRYETDNTWFETFSHNGDKNYL
ncbi:MAG: hypothetical protein WBB69_06300 [Anaerolineales bacterium]